MNVNVPRSFCVQLILVLSAISAFSQQPVTVPSPTPVDDSIRIRTEEVRLNVMAQSSYGRFVASLKPDDLLVVEEGTPQTITSMRRMSANVLFLLDTGGDLNLVKNTVLTKLTTKLAIDNLAPDDSLAVVEYDDKIQTVSDWTTDRKSVYANLDKKLFSGKRARFAQGLNAAVNLFSTRPLENRHIVIISDGLDSVAGETAVHQAMQNLLAANVTVHVISYTKLEEQAAQKSAQRFKMGKGDTKPRVPEEVFEEMLRGRSYPMDPNRADEVRKYLRAMNSAQRLLIIDLDNARIRNMRDKQRAVSESEPKLQALADDTGGMFQAPEEVATMWTFAADVAKAIDSQYVITYNPTKAIDSPEQVRKVRVSSYCDGVTIRSRQKLIVRASEKNTCDGERERSCR